METLQQKIDNEIKKREMLNTEITRAQQSFEFLKQQIIGSSAVITYLQNMLKEQGEK